MFSSDPIKNNLTWLSEDNIESYVNEQADLVEKYPHVASQVDSLCSLFVIIALLCLVAVIFIFISKAGII